jgi:hypothetical protein
MNDFAVCIAIACIFFKEVKLRDLKMGDDSPNPASWKISARKHRTIMPENLKLFLLTAVVKTSLPTYTDKFFPLRQSRGRRQVLGLRRSVLPTLPCLKAYTCGTVPRSVPSFSIYFHCISKFRTCNTSIYRP